MIDTVCEIDDLMRAVKTLAVEPTWIEEDSVGKLTAPVLRDGVVPGGLRLQISAMIRGPAQRGDAVLICQNRPICCLAFRPKGPHPNPAHPHTPAALRFVKLPAERSPLYGWPDNRQWPRGQNDRLAARVLDHEPASMAAAIDFFLADCNIKGDVPPPPGGRS